MSAPADPKISPRLSLVAGPRKLRDDAIIEAVCQLQFESTELPEIVIGRLGDGAKWPGFAAMRLSTADIPAPLRNSDPNLKFAPLIALRRKDGSRIIQIGERVISYHLVGVKAYCGWDKFKEELASSFGTFFGALPTSKVQKISFRYINAIVADRHLVSDIHNLNLEIRVNGEKLSGPINLNYVESNETHHTTTRVAHTNFVQIMQGSAGLPAGTSAVVDVEVTTPEKFLVSKHEDVMDWVEIAHSREKDAFFKLIPPDVLSNLKED